LRRTLCHMLGHLEGHCQIKPPYFPAPVLYGILAT
jgi:hypothetical protein